MYAVIDEMECPASRTGEFEDAWAQWTRALYRVRGSLGSRLHQTAEGQYLAYTYWPSQAAYEATDAAHLFTKEETDWRDRLLNATSRITTLHAMHVVRDLLQPGPAPAVPRLSSPGLVLLHQGAVPAKAMLQFYSKNRAHLAPTSPPCPAEHYSSEGYWEQAQSQAVQELANGTAVRFAVLRADAPETVIGTVNFSQIVGGPFLACYLGFALDEACQGQGSMTAALKLAIPHMWERGLHRIMANHLPNNQPSARVLRRLGFVSEGLAKDYLFIDGQWRDHVLTSLTHAGATPPGSPAAETEPQTP